MNKKYLAMFFGVFAALTAADVEAATSPSQFKMKIRKVQIASGDDCANPTTVFETADPQYVDMLQTPTIASGEVSNGTYNCLIFEMHPEVQFTPAANDGAGCVSGTSYTINVAGTATDYQTLYISTKSVMDPATCDMSAGCSTPTAEMTACSSTANPFASPATSTCHGLKLNGGLVLDGDKTATFFADATNKITGSSGCQMNPPVFGFR